MANSSLDLPNGSIITVFNCKNQVTSGHLLVGKKSKNVLTFSKPQRPYHYLHVKQSGFLVYRDSSDRGNTFNMKCLEESEWLNAHAIQSCVNGGYLYVNDDGELDLHEKPHELLINVVSTEPILFFQDPRELQHGAGIFLSSDRVRRFVNEGYIQIPEVVMKDKTNACLRILNHYLGVPGALIPGGTQGESIGKFSGGITHRDEVNNLFVGNVCKIIEWLFDGPGTCDVTSLNAQIAFRFPEIAGEVGDIDCTGESTVTPI